MSDQIKLTIPAEQDFRPIAHLVVGGLGIRLDLTFEDLDDLQVALEALLGCRDDDGDIEIVVDASDGAVRASVAKTTPASTLPARTAASAARTVSVGTTFGETAAQRPARSSHCRA